MAPFRPSNINTRLVSNTGGNAGVIGPRTCPFSPIQLGCRFDNVGAKGRYNISESYCQGKCGGAAGIDCKGLFICCGPSTNKWFVAPSCAEVSRDWYTRADAVTVANSCMGSCGWFVPTCGQAQNPGACCRSYWDSYAPGPGAAGLYWTNSEACHPGSRYAWKICMNHGFVPNGAHLPNKGTAMCVRAFRCTAT